MTPPPVAVTTRLTVPVVAVLLAVKVSVELPLPGAAIEVGLKLAVTPVGRAETDSETAELNPPLTLVESVLLPELPWTTERLAGEALSVNVGVAAALTVRAIIMVWVTPPPVPVTVTFTVPVVAVLLAVKVRLELPAPGAAMEAGLKLAVTPEGSPETESETAALNPPLTVVVTVLLAELPWVMLSAEGDGITMKLAVICWNTSEIGVALAALPACVRP